MRGLTYLLLALSTASVAFSTAIPNPVEAGDNIDNFDDFDIELPANITDTIDTPPELDTRAAAKVSKVGGRISRAEIISRGNYWISRHVPYSMSRTHRDPQGKKYRTDCSGFVSMAWHTKPPGANTSSLLKIVKQITWGQLKSGDAVGTLGAGTGGSGGHVTIFVKWANKKKTRYVGIECRGTKYGCVKHERNIKWKVGKHVSKPYRYKKVIN